MTFFSCTKPLKSGMCFPLTAHLSWDWPHVKCSVATCGQCLPCWKVQLCNKMQAVPTPAPTHVARGQYLGSAALLQPLVYPAFQTSTSVSIETTHAPCSRLATMCKGASSASTPSAVRSLICGSAISKSWLLLRKWE